MRFVFVPAIDTSDKPWIPPIVESALDYIILDKGLHLHIKAENDGKISSEFYQGDHVHDTDKGVLVPDKRTILKEFGDDVKVSLLKLLSRFPKDDVMKGLELVHPEAFENNKTLTSFLKQFEEANFRAYGGNVANYLDGRKWRFFPEKTINNMWWFGLDATYKTHYGYRGHMDPTSKEAFSRTGRMLNFDFGGFSN